MLNQCIQEAKQSLLKRKNDQAIKTTSSVYSGKLLAVKFGVESKEELLYTLNLLKTIRTQDINRNYNDSLMVVKDARDRKYSAIRKHLQMW